MELSKNVFEQIPVSDIQLKGWALRQLQIQANGISGTLCDFWPDVKESAWIGGDKDGWERFPYWLDGYIPLAFLLKREDMIERVTGYMDYIITHQQEDGWICPGKSRDIDMWSYILICKVLTVWQDMTGDERVEEVLYRALKRLDYHLEEKLLLDWGTTRWFETLIPIARLYERRPEGWLLQLARKLSLRGFDWLEFFSSQWPYKTIKNWKQWGLYSHVVNNAMALRQGALQWRFSGDEELFDATEHMQALLDKYHGMVTGVFTGDECLAGTSPIQGTELCAVVEYMYSLEHLVKATGRVAWADRLERVAFNALPATFSPDMQTHQYNQQVNQIMCGHIDNPVYRTNGADGNMFGVAPIYGCCTANLSQGWPKFMLSAYMKRNATETDGEGLAVISYIPCELNTKIKGIPVSVRTEGNYPFEEEIRLTVTPSMPFAFPLYLRIPEWVEYADIYVGDERIRPKKGEFYKLEGYWEDSTEVRIVLHSEFKLTARPEELYALTRGPLVYSMPIKERWEEYPRSVSYHIYPHCDYSVYPESEWNYAFYTSAERPEIEEHKNDSPAIFVFSPETPPLEVYVKARKVEWPVIRGAAARIPHTKNASDEVERIRLIPYGCTNLRMTELPLIKD